jgi:hypothetical protein
MSEQDRLYELLPVVLRQRDAEQGYPLRGLLRVIGEQADEVENDINQLYENWFIETCQDWAVPYIGDLVGYQPVHEAGEPGDITTPQGLQRNKILISRREVANTIRYRRRKGALSLLEQICSDVAGWPSRGVEFYKLLCLFQPINHLRMLQGRTVDLHSCRALSLIDGPFDETAHTIDVRNAGSSRGAGQYNIPSIGLFVWRLRPYSVTQTRARNLERHDPLRYTFSILGNETPLYTMPQQEKDSSHIAEEINLPIPITIQALKERTEDYYGPNKSLQIWLMPGGQNGSWQLVQPEDLVVQSLKGWRYRLEPGKIAVDPERGLMAFPPGELAKRVKVSYHYAFSGDIGGGEYQREIFDSSMQAVSTFRKSDLSSEMLRRLLPDSRGRHESALSAYLWICLPEAVKNFLAKHGCSADLPHEVEKGLLDELNRQLSNQDLYSSGYFPDPVEEAQILINKRKESYNRGEKLNNDEIARLNRLLLEGAYDLPPSHKVYRIGEKEQWKSINEALAAWGRDEPRYAILEIEKSGAYSEGIEISLKEGQSLQLRAANGARPVLGLFERILDLPEHFLVEGKKGSRFVMDGLLISGLGMRIGGEMAEVIIRHSTLVPGFTLYPAGHLREQPGPSLSLFNLKVQGKVKIEHSILGPIQVIQGDIRSDPIEVQVSDSIIDAIGREFDAVHGMSESVANAILTLRRCTVLGQTWVHAIELAENSIFAGQVMAARSQRGCVRFSYAPEGSRTPKRFNCQPDLAELRLRASLEADLSGEGITEDELNMRLEDERSRVAPQFNSTRYGTPAYCRLANHCSEEIKRGAEDESEMGAFHDLFQPQRAANLRARLEEYTPAGMDAGIFYES